LRLGFGGVDQKPSGDAAVIFDGLQQFLFVLLAHARQFADLAFARKLFHAIDVADLIGAPDQCNRLRPQALNLQQLEHRRMIFLEQVGLHAELAVLEEFLQVDQHPFADAGNGQNLLGFGDDVFDLLRVIFDGLGGIAVGADAERILAVDFEQIGGFVENRGDGFIVHGLKINKNRVRRQRLDTVESQPAGRGLAGVDKDLVARPRRRIRGSASVTELSRLAYVRRLRSLLTFGDFELDLIPLLQALVSLGCDRAVVNENVGTICASDEPVAFRIIEPFHRAFQTFHA
jgi:hypothetical protein